MGAKVKTGHERLIETVKVALMAAIISILGPISVPLPFTPVPISLGLLAVYLSAYLLGAKTGVLSVIIYILVGLVGLPVFSSYTGGAAKLFGPTGGYIIGYIFVALLGGLFADRFSNKFFMPLLGMALGTVICYIFGSGWLAFQMGLTFKQALVSGVIPYIGFDAAKMVIATFLGKQVKPLINR